MRKLAEDGTSSVTPPDRVSRSQNAPAAGLPLTRSRVFQIDAATPRADRHPSAGMIDRDPAGAGLRRNPSRAARERNAAAAGNRRGFAFDIVHFNRATAGAGFHSVADLRGANAPGARSQICRPGNSAQIDSARAYVDPRFRLRGNGDGVFDRNSPEPLDFIPHAHDVSLLFHRRTLAQVGGFSPRALEAHAPYRKIA